MKNNYPDNILEKKIIKFTAIIVFLMGSALVSRAQLNPFQSMYYQNQYIYNPSMAGLDRALNINYNYRQQWSSFAGTPITSSITTDYQPTDRVGIGLNVNDDQAGLIRQTRVMGTYAYHLPLSDHNQKLNFGLSLGVDDSRINYSKLVGDLTDDQIAQYNQLKPYIDSDFGIAYTSDNLYIGAAVPNLRTVLFKSADYRFDADRMLFILAASYKIPLQQEDRAFILEPLVAYRVVKGYQNIVDGGVNFIMNNYGLYMQAIYHSSKSVGLGFGLDQQVYRVNFSYNLETGPLSNYTTGTFELGIDLKLFKK
jgi:type IX secretion system PorP/SprF family membrane protein